MSADHPSGARPSGKYYEELVVGKIYPHAATRTVTETDNLFFTALTMNTQPLFLDDEYAQATWKKPRMVNGIFLLGLVSASGVAELTAGTVVGNLGFKQVKYLAPVVIGDTIYSETEVLDKRPSKSRPGEGIVQFFHRGRNQRGEIVCTIHRVTLMRMRPAEAIVHDAALA
jgi:acyl dehydratase